MTTGLAPRPERLFNRSDVAALDWWVGLLIAFPIAWPGVPFYWLAFLAFALVVPRARVGGFFLATLLLLIALGLLSSALSPYAGQIAAFRSFYSVGFYLFLLFGYGVRRIDAFFRGFLLGAGALAGAVIILFVLTGQYRHGVQVFLYPNLRDWGQGILPDWPNYLAFLLGLAAILLTTRERRPLPAAICAVGAILTTSRTGMLAAAICAAVEAVRLLRTRRGRWVVVGLALVGAVAIGPTVYRVTQVALDSPLVQQRLLRSQDRVILYRFSLGLVAQRPLLGVGAVTLDASIGSPYDSFHNGYLEQLVRGGVVGFLVWLVLMFPLRLWHARARHVWLPVGFFAISAAFNTIFKEPHLFLIYSVLLAEIAPPATSAPTAQPPTQPTRPCENSFVRSIPA